MKPFYWQGTTNFGDYMNQWLWPQLLSGYLKEDDGICLVGIGSLLKSSLNMLDGKKVIFGTGSGYGAFPHPSNYESWKFYFVRGPLTAKQFGLSAEKGLIDGAWLAGLLPQYQKNFTKKGISFIPHWTTADTGNWRKVCERAGIKYICPLSDLTKVLSEIGESELVITESLHGAIMADLFRTPWVPISISPKFLPFKWVDWFESVNVDASIKSMPLSDLFEYLYCRQPWRKIHFDLAPVSLDYSVAKEDEHAKIEQPNYLYRQKLKLKRYARNTRRDLLNRSANFRDSFLFSSWNEKHQDKLATLITQLGNGPHYLSSDIVHREKLDRLNSELIFLKRDYDEGRLFL